MTNAEDDFFKEEYPSEWQSFKEVYGYGGIRIYQVSEAQAKKIAKEFPAKFNFRPPFRDVIEGDQLFYMNVNHGQQHFIFSIPSTSTSE